MRVFSYLGVFMGVKGEGAAAKSIERRGPLDRKKGKQRFCCFVELKQAASRPRVGNA